MGRQKPKRRDRVYVGFNVPPDLYSQLVERQKQLNEHADRHVSLGDVVRNVLRVEFPKPALETSNQLTK